MNVDITASSEWGDFIVIPTEGWKISSQFIDYESGLLIVSEYPLDKNNVIIKNGNRYVPQNTYVIDCNERKVLDTDAWRSRFDYSIKEFLIDDTHLKMIIKRVPHENLNIDSIESKLIDTKANRVLRNKRSLAFRPDEQKDLYDAYLEDLDKQKKIKSTSRNLYSLEYQYHRDYSSLKVGDVLFMYRDNNDRAYKVIVNEENEVLLLKGKEEIPKDYSKRSTINYIQIAKYDSPDDFWLKFSQDQLWFQTFSPFSDNETRKVDNNLFAYHVIHQGNKIRYSSNIDWEKYELIIRWEGSFNISPLLSKELIQVCPNCMSRVRFYPRYPTSICNQCTSKITDKEGRRVYYVFDSNTQRYKGRYSEKESYDSRSCYIEDREYFVTEARMTSGLVIQLKSAEKYMI